MKKIYFTLLCSFLFYTLYAQHQPSSRICTSCIGGGGGGGGTGITCPVTQAILYVDASIASSGDGKSWVTAKKTLQEALFIANQCNKVYAIRIAQGLYKPTTGTDRNNTFFIGNKYNLTGGYAPGGGGSSNPALYPTILEGDIGTMGTHTDNSFHVLVVAGFTGNITIEGLQIKNGYANGTGEVQLYDDVYLARFQSAGMYVHDVAGIVTVRNCAFSNNVATGIGGAITSPTVPMNILQCIFYNNSSGFGDVMWNYNGSFIVKNSTIYNINPNGVLGTVALSNSIVWGNDNILNSTSAITAQYCIVQGGRSGTGIFANDPQLSNTADGDGADNVWFTSDDGLRLKYCSPAINRGNNGMADDSEIDIAGNDRIYNTNIDIGAYEYPLSVIPGSANALAADGEETDTYVYGGTTALTSNCRMIVSVLPNGASPVDGNTTAKVFVETVVPEYNGKHYVARHYDITHTRFKPAPTARVTLYFTQDDFTSYNNAAGSKKDHLPTSASDDANKAKLRVNQFHGSNVDGAGLPSSYDGTFSFLDPADEDIIWHAGKGGEPGYWTVSFDVTGFSGFFITAGTSSALPVEWVSFTATLLQQKVQINWQTASEHNSSHFIVQRSANGIDYNNTGRVNAAGNSSILQSYSWIDDIAALKNVSTLYYRLLQVDKDGKHAYSKVMQLSLEIETAWVSSIANPVKHTIHFVVQAKNPGLLSVKIIDIQGRPIIKSKQLLNQGVNNLRFPATHLAKGIYLLELVQDGKRVLKKLVKE